MGRLLEYDAVEREAMFGRLTRLTAAGRDSTPPPPPTASRVVVHVERGLPAETIAAWERLAREDGRPS